MINVARTHYYNATIDISRWGAVVCMAFCNNERGVCSHRRIIWVWRNVFLVYCNFLELTLQSASSGVYVALLPAPVMAMGEIQTAGLRIGMASVGFGLGLLAGTPIAGAIINSDESGNYKGAGYYAGKLANHDVSILDLALTVFFHTGSVAVAAVVFLFITRQLRLEGKLRGKM